MNRPHNIEDVIERVEKVEHHMDSLDHKLDLHIARQEGFEKDVKEFQKSRTERDESINRRVMMVIMPLVIAAVSVIVFIMRLERDIQVTNTKIDVLVEHMTMDK